MEGPFDTELNMGYEMIECWIHYMTLNFDLLSNPWFDPAFSRSDFETAVSYEWVVWVTYIKRNMH